jgi:hypothetical protein
MKKLAPLLIMAFGAMATLAGVYGLSIFPESVIPSTNPESYQLTALVGIVVIGAGWGFYKGKWK